MRAAIVEWLAVRSVSDLPLPRLLASLDKKRMPIASHLHATRDVIVRVGFTEAEAQQLQAAARCLGWGRMTPNMVIVSALAEWTDLRGASAKPIDSLAKAIKAAAG